MVLKINEVVLHESVYDKLIDKHGIDPEDVERAMCSEDPEPFFEKKTSDRYYGYCQVPESGQYLFVVFVLEDVHRARIITTREMNSKEKKHYRKLAGE